jgi:hypothetical protein
VRAQASSLIDTVAQQVLKKAYFRERAKGSCLC